MRVQIIYTKHAVSFLRKLPKKEQRIILSKIDFYTQQEKPLSHAKKLQPPFEKLYRFRIGQYRAIFEISKEGTLTLLVILKIGLRKDTY